MDSFFLDIAKGNIGKHSVVHKFGFNAAAGTTEETVWPEGGRYPWPAAASTVTISSADADDTAAGTGARTATIYGLDANYDLIEETLTMDGTSGVTSSNSYLRIYRVKVATAGSSLSNEGIIYVGTGSITAGKPAVVLGEIGALEAQSLMGVYTIPNGYTGYLLRLRVATGKADNVTFRLRVNEDLTGILRTIDKIEVNANSIAVIHDIPKQFATKTDLEVTAQASTGTDDAETHFELILVQD